MKVQKSGVELLI